MSAIAMAENPAVLDPMHALNGAQRTILRKLDREGPALSLGFRKGWMLGGTKYTGRALDWFHAQGLARCWKDPADGHVKLGLNEAGLLAAYRITPLRSAVDPVPSQDDD